MPSDNPPIDANIARLLYQLPQYQNWQDIKLPEHLKTELDAMEQQRLMCVIAYSMRRLMDEQAPSRKAS